MGREGVRVLSRACLSSADLVSDGSRFRPSPVGFVGKRPGEISSLKFRRGAVVRRWNTCRLRAASESTHTHTHTHNERR